MKPGMETWSKVRISQSFINKSQQEQTVKIIFHNIIVLTTFLHQTLHKKMYEAKIGENIADPNDSYFKLNE